jgi:hypothetical protein
MTVYVNARGDHSRPATMVLDAHEEIVVAIGTPWRCPA